ncbi:TPA: HD domain-containing protein [Legionella pneumophila]
MARQNQQKTSKNHIITDPIHEVMSFDQEEKDLIKEFIDLPIFQRLKRIKQLGCADMVFPGAVHTRFSHSLGACYIAKLACDQLDINGKDRQIIMGASLLHDIGHGPFSHAFESIFDGLGPAAISHDEHWTPKFIDSINSELSRDIGRVFSDSFSGYYKPLISSQLDVDRLDYLLRDSHFCGVPYGNIDLKWIISCMKIEKVDGKRVVCITPKGIGAIEHYILSRRLMTKYIYYHSKKNSAEYLIRTFLLNIEEHLDMPENKDSPLFLFMKKFFEYAEDVKDMNEADKKARAKQFIEDTFKFYQHITDDDIWVILRKLSIEKSIAGKLADKICNRQLPASFLINPARIMDAQKIIQHYKDKEKEDFKWRISFDKLNFQSYGTKKTPVYVAERNSITNLYYSSVMLHQISDRPEPTYFVYIDEKHPKENEILEELSKYHCLTSPFINDD